MIVTIEQWGDWIDLNTGDERIQGMKKFIWLREDHDFVVEQTTDSRFRLMLGGLGEIEVVYLSAKELAELVDGMLDVLCSAREKKPEPAVTVPDRGRCISRQVQTSDCPECWAGEPCLIHRRGQSRE